MAMSITISPQEAYEIVVHGFLYRRRDVADLLAREHPHLCREAVVHAIAGGPGWNYLFGPWDACGAYRAAVDAGIDDPSPGDVAEVLLDAEWPHWRGWDFRGDLIGDVAGVLAPRLEQVRRCQATTRKGTRCRNVPRGSEPLCNNHRD